MSGFLNNHQIKDLAIFFKNSLCSNKPLNQVYQEVSTKMREFSNLNIQPNDWISIFSNYAISKEDIDNLFKVIRNVDIFERLPQDIDRNQISGINRKVLKRKILPRNRIIVRKKVLENAFNKDNIEKELEVLKKKRNRDKAKKLSRVKSKIKLLSKKIKENDMNVLIKFPTVDNFNHQFRNPFRSQIFKKRFSKFKGSRSNKYFLFNLEKIDLDSIKREIELSCDLISSDRYDKMNSIFSLIYKLTKMDESTNQRFPANFRAEDYRNSLISAICTNMNNLINKYPNTVYNKFILSNIAHDPIFIVLCEQIKLIFITDNYILTKIGKNISQDKYDYFKDTLVDKNLRNQIMRDYYSHKKNFKFRNLNKMVSFIPKRSFPFAPSDDFYTKYNTSWINNNIVKELVGNSSYIHYIDILNYYNIPIDDPKIEPWVKNQNYEPKKNNKHIQIKRFQEKLNSNFSFQMAFIDYLRSKRNIEIRDSIKWGEEVSLLPKEYEIINISHSKDGVLRLPLPIEFFRPNDDYYYSSLATFILLDPNLNDIPSFLPQDLKDFIKDKNPNKNEVDVDPDGYYLVLQNYLKTDAFLSRHITSLFERFRDINENFFVQFIVKLEGLDGVSKVSTINIFLKNTMEGFQQQIIDQLKNELDFFFEQYEYDNKNYILTIIDIKIRNLLIPKKLMSAVVAYGKFSTCEINPTFSPTFTSLKLCLFECFMFLYFAKQYNSYDWNFIKNCLNIGNHVLAMRQFILDFYFSDNVIPELRKVCIDGDLLEFLRILDVYYNIEVSYYNIIEKKFYNENNKFLTIVWSNFHSYIVETKKIQKKLKPKNFVLKKNKDEKNEKEIDVITYVLDIETLTLKNNDLIWGNQKPYLIVTYTENDINSFWGLNNCIPNFISWIETLFNNNIQYNIWAHNGFGFDYRFLINEFFKKNYNVEIIGNHNKMVGFKLNNITFYDFCLFFPTKLNTLSKEWGFGEKLEFQHIGLDEDNYEEIKCKAEEYCIQDCVLLYKLVTKFSDLVKNSNFGVTNWKFYTAPQLAVYIFKNKFLKYNLYGSSGEIYNREKESYFGGMTLAFKTFSKTLYHYDVNSSYPSSMLESKMPVKFITERDFIQNEEIIPWYMYKVNFSFPPNVIISNLPQRVEDEVVYLKEGENRYSWGIEIISAKGLGCEFNITKVYEYEGKDIFSDFIKYLYSERLKAKKEKNTALVALYKLLMNSLYGKFGQKLNKKTKIVGINEFPQSVDLLNKGFLDKINFLTSDIIEYEYNDEQQFYNQIGSLVRLPAFITAYSRYLLLKPFIEGKMKLDSLYYCDTDSLFVDCKLPDEYVSEVELGHFKLENVSKKGIFLGPKMYYYEIDEYMCKNEGIEKRYNDPRNICKIKGVNKSVVPDTYESFKEIMTKNSKTFSFVYFKKYFSEIEIGNITKRIWCKRYKRDYYQNGNSKCWDNIEEFLDNKKQKLIQLKNPIFTIENNAIVDNQILDILNTRKDCQKIERKELKEKSQKLHNFLTKHEALFSIDFVKECLEDKDLLYDIFVFFNQSKKDYNKTFQRFFPELSNSSSKYCVTFRKNLIDFFLLDESKRTEFTFYEMFHSYFLNETLECLRIDINIIKNPSRSKTEVIEFMMNEFKDYQNEDDFLLIKDSILFGCPQLSNQEKKYFIGFKNSKMKSDFNKSILYFYWNIFYNNLR